MSDHEPPPTPQQTDRSIIAALADAPSAGIGVMAFVWGVIVTITTWWSGASMSEFFETMSAGFAFYLIFMLIFAIIGSVLMAVIGLPILWVFWKRGIVSRRSWSATGAVAALMTALCWTGGFGAVQNAEAGVSAKILGPLLFSPILLLGGAVTGITAWAIVRPNRWRDSRPGA